MVNARIQEMLQSPEPPFIQASISDEEMFIAKTKYCWGGQVVSSENGLATAVAATYREMLRATRCGFTASEYERAKARMLANAESAYNSRDKKKSASYCREYVRHFIDNQPIPGEQNNLALNALSVTLLEEIREKEGGTYGIGAYGDLSGTPAPRQQAYMQIVYQTAPDKYEYLNKRIHEIVADFTANGPSEENLAKGKEFYLKEHGENLRENHYWAQALGILLDTKVDITANYEDVLKSITADDARKAVNAMLKQNNHSEVIMVGTKKQSAE